MSKGWFGDHMRKAIDAADRLRAAGFAPFVPHLCFFWDLMGSGWSYEDWMAYDKAMLLKCDALLRLPGESHGADREVAWAQEAGISTYHLIGGLIRDLK